MISERAASRVRLITTRTRMISFLLVMASSPLMAAEAPTNMHVFNVTCPTKTMAATLDKAYHECNNGYDVANGGCQKFVDVFKQLLPEYDCQRPFDTTPTKNYVVPAIWLAGDAALEDYMRLLWRMASQKEKMFKDQSFEKPVLEARVIFASKEFRHALDGAFAEEYLDRSKEIERELNRAASKGARVGSHAQP